MIDPHSIPTLHDIVTTLDQLQSSIADLRLMDDTNPSELPDDHSSFDEISNFLCAACAGIALGLVVSMALFA